jgi:hypothetical protein
MALPEMSVVCTNCKTRIRARPQRTLLALLKFHCFSCRQDFLYPLTSGYRKTYWLLVIFMVIAIVAMFAHGQIGFPSLLTAIAAAGLYKDASIRKQVAATREVRRGRSTVSSI